jgi:hypothetical protein
MARLIRPTVVGLALIGLCFLNRPASADENQVDKLLVLAS